MSVALGLDIGGANLKAADSEGRAAVRPFELWRRPERLADELAALVASLPPAERWAVTMTGELADCYPTKRAGVDAIVTACERAAGGRPVGFWSVAGRFVGSAEARAEPLEVAAANWHLLATFAGRFAPDGPGLLFDVGSTTCDIIPLLDGKPAAAGLTDDARLRSGELVYTGARRTPVCALVGGRVSAEFFATADDAYLLLGRVRPDADDLGTADGRPRTVAAAHARLARMLGGDSETTSVEATKQLARDVSAAQRRLLAAGLRQVVGRRPDVTKTVVLAGSGEWLAWDAMREFMRAVGPAGSLVSLTERFGRDNSMAACALAAARLMAEGQGATPASRLHPPSGPVLAIKLGGSLYDLPDLAGRLRGWLADRAAGARVLLVPGGGPLADSVRGLDRTHQLGEEAAHWVALSALSAAARMVAGWLPGAAVVGHPEDAGEVWARGGVAVVDCCAFARRDDTTPGALPHSWSVTTDSISARVARVAGAGRLVLLKSVDIAQGTAWPEAAADGRVDALFPEAAIGLDVEAVNLRAAEWAV